MIKVRRGDVVTTGRRRAPPGWMRVPEFAEQNGLGINQVYNAVKRGELAHIRIGSTILIAEDALARRLAQMQQPAETVQEAGR